MYCAYHTLSPALSSFLRRHRCIPVVIRLGCMSRDLHFHHSRPFVYATHMLLLMADTIWGGAVLSPADRRSVQMADQIPTTTTRIHSNVERKSWVWYWNNLHFCYFYSFPSPADWYQLIYHREVVNTVLRTWLSARKTRCICLHMEIRKPKTTSILLILLIINRSASAIVLYSLCTFNWFLPSTKTYLRLLCVAKWLRHVAHIYLNTYGATCYMAGSWESYRLQPSFPV